MSKLKSIEKIKNDKNLSNKIILGIFLFFVASIIILRLTTNVITDLGWWHGKLHIGYADGSKKSSEFLNTLRLPDGKLPREWQVRLSQHPYFFWSFTQFTWQTTFIIFFILLFRFFRFDGPAPKWIRWTMTQRTLSLITMYDIIVMSVFWSSFSNSFFENFPTDPLLRALEITVTISVHAVIPFFIIVYSFIYLIKGENASRLEEKFVFKGMIYPIIYLLFYVLVAFIWKDPYAVTDLQTNSGWWKVGVLFVVIYILLGIMIIFHNAILFKFNKMYNSDMDYDIQQRKIRKEKKESK